MHFFPCLTYYLTQNSLAFHFSDFLSLLKKMNQDCTPQGTFILNLHHNVYSKGERHSCFCSAVRASTMDQRVVGFSSRSGMYLGCRFEPWPWWDSSGVNHQSLCLSHMDVSNSLFPPLPASLKINGKNIPG